ncbi:MAG: hypothetical protein WCK26_01590 [Candidatus Saccharibacteria bacterium]
MFKRLRTNQGGSVAIYIITGILISAGLVGAVYLLNQRSEGVRNEKANIAYEKSQLAKKTKKTINSNTNNTPKVSVGKEIDDIKKVSIDSKDLPVSGNEFSIDKLIAIYSLVVVMTSYILSTRELSRSL